MSSIKICSNGHCYIGDVENTMFCTKCGEKLLLGCEYCAKEFDRKYISDIPTGIKIDYKTPKYCHNCGKPYPWTEKHINNVYNAIDKDDVLDDNSKQQLKEIIPDIIKEIPESDKSARMFKDILKQVGESLKEVLIQLATEIASEATKKIIFGNAV